MKKYFTPFEFILLLTIVLVIFTLGMCTGKATGNDERRSKVDETDTTEVETVEDSPAIPAPDTTPPEGDDAAAPVEPPTVPPHQQEVEPLDDDAPAAEDAELGDGDV